MAEADNLGTDFLQARRPTEASRAGDELLQSMGLDALGNPLVQQQTPTAPQMNPFDIAAHRAGAAARIKKIQEQAKAAKKEEQPSFFRDVVGGTVSEVGRSIVGGALEGTKEIFETADSLAGWIGEKLGTPKGGAFANIAKLIPEGPESQTVPGQLIRGFSQFLTAFIPASKIAKLVGLTGTITRSMAAGAIADLAAFDPEDPNLAKALTELDPRLKIPLLEFLATQPGDSEAINRLKRVGEGLGLGVFTELLVGVGRAMRGRSALKKAETAFNQAAQQGPPPIIPEVLPPTGGAGRREGVRPAGQDIPLGEGGGAGVMVGERRGLPPPEMPRAEIEPGAPTGGAGQVDIFGRPQDVRLPGGGVMQTQRLALPEPGQRMPSSGMTMQEADALRLAQLGESNYERTRIQNIAGRIEALPEDPTVQTVNKLVQSYESQFVDEGGRVLAGRGQRLDAVTGEAVPIIETVDEVAEAIEREFAAQEYLRQSPRGRDLLRAELEKVDISGMIRESPIVRLAQEEAISRGGMESMVEAIVRDQSELFTTMAKVGAEKPAALVPKVKRMASTEIDFMVKAVSETTDPKEALRVAIDRSQPAVVRQAAVNRVGDFPMDLSMIEGLSAAELRFISRSPMFPAEFKAFAKAKVEPRSMVERLETSLQGVAEKLQDETIARELIEGANPRQIVNEFWTTTYERLPEAIRRKFEDFVEAFTGRRPTPEAPQEAFPAEKLGAAVDELEEGERGLLALMQEANARIKDFGEKGEISQGAIYAMARAAVGGAVGLSQGDTLDERITNALIGMGVGAAASPALIKRLIQSMEKGAPRTMKVVKSFDPPPTRAAGVEPGASKFTPGQRRALRATVENVSPENVKKFLETDPSKMARPPELGTTTLKINWENIGDQADIEDVINQISAVIPKEIDEARRGVISKELSDEMARRFGIRDDTFLGLKPGDILNIEKTKALIATTGDAFNHLNELKELMKNGQPVESQFRLQLGKASALLQRMLGVRAEQGRVLPVWGDAAQLMSRAAKFNTDFGLMTIGGKSIDNVPVEKLVQMLDQLEPGIQQATFVGKAVTLGRNALLEAWINGLLSNPVTHAANAISNAATMGISITERQIAGFMGNEIARGEAAEMIHALAGGWMDGWKLARKAFISGESNFSFGGKVDTRHQRTITAENFGLTGQIGRGVDFMGTLVSSPGRALMAADDFFKSLNYRMELRAQSYRQATKEGLDGPALAKRIDELNNSTSFQSMVKDQAEGFAAYQTFNNSLGEFGNGFLRWLDDHPWARILFPFVRTPVNIAKYTLERTPLIGLAMKSMRDDMIAGGARRDLALAKQAMGGLTFLTAGYLAAQGMITGGGPLDKDLRDIKRTTGWQPYSFKIGDEYISYSRFDPLGFMLGMAADLIEKGGELDEETIGGVTMAAVMALKETFLSKTYLKGVADFVEAVESPDRKWETYYKKLAGSLVPAGVAQISRILDPQIKEVNSAWDAIVSRLPGFSNSVPPRRNIWGEPIELQGGVGPDIVSPFYASKKIDDPVTDEILRLEMSIDMPQKYIYGLRPSDSFFKNPDPRAGVRLTQEEYSRYVELSGNALKLDGKGLHDRLSEVIEAPDFQRQSDLSKRTIIQKYFSAYRDASQAQLLQEFPDLLQAVQERQRLKVEALAPPQ